MAITKKISIIGSLIFFSGLAYLGYEITGSDKKIYLPGEMTNGHYLIETKCESCHGKPFSGDNAMEKACNNCHKQDLKQGED